ncbi:translocation/assembly module TamB domain-containing protein [Labilibacter marinus]|uniref:translocation/assembly module TamB domain-containing protein n=1 Tax=Labilibacter marinus TaxID=1477105 RepID=UPI00094F71CD|nr:translocation/assembly module TamB domain-containing protein [Labilibacter marinus]
MRKGLKYILWIVATLLLVLILIYLLLLSSPVQQKIKAYALNEVNSIIHGRVDIDNFSTNIFSSIHLKDITVYDSREDTLVYIQNLSVDYNLKALLYKELLIKNLKLDSFYLKVEQEQDTWNFTELFPENEEEEESDHAEFSYSINIRNIALSKGHVSTQTPYEFIPNNITGLHTAASFKMRRRQLSFELKQLSAWLHQPELQIKNISFVFDESEKGMSLNNFELITGSSHLTIDKGQYSTDAADVSGQLVSDNSNDLHVFLPDIRLNTIPEVEFTYHDLQDTTSVQLSLSIPEERIETHVHLIRSSKGSMPIQGVVQLQNVNPESWYQLDSIHSLLNGTVQFSSNDLSNYLNKHQVELNLKNSTIYNYKVDSLWAIAKQHHKLITSELAVYLDSSSISGNIELMDPDSAQQYSANLLFNKLHVKELEYNNAKQSILNGSVSVKGEGFNVDSLMLNSSIQLFESNIYGLNIDSARATGAFHLDTIRLERVDISTPYSELHAQGQYLMSDSSVVASSSLINSSAEEIKPFYDLPATYQMFTARFNVSGNLDSLIMDGHSVVQNMDAYDVKTKKASLQVDAQWIENQLFTQAALAVGELQSEYAQLDSSLINIQYSDSLLEASLHTYSDTLSAMLRGSYLLSDTVLIKIDSLSFGGPKQRFYTRLPISTQWSEQNIAFSPIHIQNSQDSIFSIKMNGELSTSGKEHVALEINALSMQTLYNYGLSDLNSTHTISSQIKLTGTADNPQLMADVSISEGQFDAIYTPELVAHIKWLEQKLYSEIQIPILKDQFITTLTMPLKAQYVNDAFIYQMPEEFEATLQVDSIHIADALNRRKLNIEAEGILEAKLLAKGSFKAPAIYGNIDLTHINYTDKKKGILLEDALMRYTIDSNKVRIDTFLMKRKSGRLNLDGEVAFKGSIAEANIKEVNIDVQAKEFYFSRYRDHILLIDGNTQFSHSEQKNRFDGDISILQSSFNLSNLSTEDEIPASTEKPILIEALHQNDSVFQVSTDTIIVDKADDHKTLDEFMETLQGQLTVHIPRNTWLKSKEMKIELMGDIEVIKNNPYFEIFGPIEINRGYYAMYGKKFVIEEGRLVFEGGEESDPLINLRAIYTYRAPDKQKKKLRLIAGGNLSEPEISFELDDSEISNADAVSIIFTGKTLDEIGSHQKSQTGVVDMGNIAAKAVGNQLGKLIDGRVGMDMIEVQASEDWKNTSFVLGKYITRDLFVKFQRSFGENTDNDEISREKITLEYELNRNLFFSVQSGTSKDMGLDVIIKFEQKVK